MNQINLAPYQDGNANSHSPLQTATPTRAIAVVKAGRKARQSSATLWIIVAWLIGTLVCELSALGAEPTTLAPTSLREKWNSRATELALTHSGIGQLERVQRDSQLRSRVEAILADAAEATQGNQPAKPVQDPAPSPSNSTSTLAQLDRRNDHGQPSTQEIAGDRPTSTPPATTRPSSTSAEDPSVKLAVGKADPGATALAWKGFPEGSIPGLVELVVHSFNELMTPVHIRPLAGGAKTLTSDSPGTKSPVTYVETELQVAADPQDETEEPVLTDASLVDSSNPTAAEQGTVDRVEVEEDLPENVVGTPREAKPTGVIARAVERPSESDVDATVDQVESPPQPKAAEFREMLSSEAARIVRTRPQLLQVPEHTFRLPPREDAQPKFAGPVVSRRATASELAVSNPPVAQPPAAQPPAAQPDNAGPPVTRVAAKWPFERNQPVKSSGVSLNVDDTDVRTVFEMLARGYHMNILVAPEVNGVVTANVEGLSPEQTLHGIVKMCGLNMQQDEGMIYIYPADKIPADARQLRVFPLDFARAATLEPTIQGLLSPVGNAYPSTLNTADNMQTQESIVVVDVPSVIAQVENYILQADQAPRQVMIEARVLEVELTDDMVHGVNFGAFSKRLNLKIGSQGLADSVSSTTNPLFFAQLDGDELNGVLDLLETTTDSKTLASPRVQVINGQNARIQVGQQLGFTVATVTQTSTIQDVQFLETGVVLSVTPTISRDNRILMQVKPEVSDGEINPETLLPEEETREVETSVLLDNHQGVIIGGLIQEKDRTVIKKLPWLGDVKHVGKFFQRREAIRSRSEIIVALVPHIIERGVQDERSAIQYERAETPLLQGPLQRTCRPWEPRLPDIVGAEKHMDVNRVNRKIP